MTLNLKILSKIKTYFSQQRKPSNRRVAGVACGTVFMALGLDALFLQRSLFTQFSGKDEDSRPLSLVEPLDLENRIDEDKNPVGRLLTERERTQISLLLGESVKKPYPLVIGELPLVILHDTAGEIDNATIHAQKQSSRGPLGDGIAAYVPRKGNAIVIRQGFFSKNRPTATAYEKGFDLLSESRRNRSLRTIWQTLNPSTRQTHLRDAIAELDPNFVIFANRAALWLNSSSDQAFNAWQSQNLESLDGAKTTAIWAIANLCKNILKDQKTALNFVQFPKNASQLLQTCQKLNPILQANRTRVGSSVNFELIQKRGSDCFTADIEVRTYNNLEGAVKIPENRAINLDNYNGEAYTDSQYETLKNLYLKSALFAGRFPQIVTHYWLDQGLGKVIGDHCDPRGLNLTKVYSHISTALEHHPDTIYGIRPQYGLNPQKKHNVWWSEAILGEKPRLTENK